MVKNFLSISLLLLVLNTLTFAQKLYKTAPQSTQTRWISPENPTGTKGSGGLINKGVKGSTFFTVKAGGQLVLMDVKGA